MPVSKNPKNDELEGAASRGRITTHRATVRLPLAVWREGRIQALHEGRDFQDLMADALRLYLKTHSKPGKVGR
jgi:hypothetical protein